MAQALQGLQDGMDALPASPQELNDLEGAGEASRVLFGGFEAGGVFTSLRDSTVFWPPTL
jgi:hypothetical protein